MEIKLEGKAAGVAVVVAIVAMVGYRMFLHGDFATNPEVRQALETSLMSRIAGDVTADTEAIRAAMDRGDHEEAERLARGTLERKVTIEELAMRGGGDDVIVRATYVVHGPGGERRESGYFRFAHSTIGGWRYRYETNAMSWYLKLF